MIESEDRLYELHSYLTSRCFSYGLSSKEARRLKTIRWNLDCIEVAQLAPNFERMEAEIKQKVKLGDDIHSFISSVNRLSVETN